MDLVAGIAPPLRTQRCSERRLGELHLSAVRAISAALVAAALAAPARADEGFWKRVVMGGG